MPNPAPESAEDRIYEVAGATDMPQNFNGLYGLVRDHLGCDPESGHGYDIHRQLTGLGHKCTVAAPSMIPRKPGERIKTDRRDSEKLAILHRSGDLTPVWVPDTTHEALRDLDRKSTRL